MCETNNRIKQKILNTCNIIGEVKILNRGDIFLIGVFNPQTNKFGIKIAKENPEEFKRFFGEHFRLGRQVSLIDFFDMRLYFYSKNQVSELQNVIYFKFINEVFTFEETIWNLSRIQ